MPCMQLSNRNMKIIVICGFLGAGKTTFLNWLLHELDDQDGTAVVENDFGEISVDEQMLSGHGVPVYSLKNGCICCSLQGDFASAIQRLEQQMHPERLFLEPSGVCNALEVARSLQKNGYETYVAALVDASRCRRYLRMMGDCFTSTLEAAGQIILTHLDTCSENEKTDLVRILRLYNAQAEIWNTDYRSEKQSAVLSRLQKIPFLDTSKLHLRLQKPTAEPLYSVTVHTSRTFSEESLCQAFERAESCGGILYRAKGYVESASGGQLQIQYVPGELKITPCSISISGILTFIASSTDEQLLRTAFA